MIKKVTIQEIAKELNLSRNTVAKALTNSDIVAFDTRETIIRKAWEMGYQKMSPSILQEYKLVDGSVENKNVIILARRELSIFWNSIIVGISDELNSNNCRMRLSFISSEDEHNLLLPRDFDDKVDAVILMSVFDPKFTELILKRNLPTVFLDFPIGAYALPNNCDVVICEGKNSVRQITETLIGQGLPRIGFIGDICYCESLKQRYEGYCEAMTLAGRRLDEGIIFTKHLPNNYSDEEVTGILEGFSSIPDAIVCGNDDVALKAIRALRKKGLSVPQDVAVTGFDNEEALAHTEPMLTTVSVRNHMLGKRLVHQLIWRMENPDFPKETVTIDNKIIYRKSSCKYR